MRGALIDALDNALTVGEFITQAQVAGLLGPFAAQIAALWDIDDIINDPRLTGERGWGLLPGILLDTVRAVVDDNAIRLRGIPNQAIDEWQVPGGFQGFGGWHEPDWHAPWGFPPPPPPPLNVDQRDNALPLGIIGHQRVNHINANNPGNARRRAHRRARNILRHVNGQAVAQDPPAGEELDRQFQQLNVNEDHDLRVEANG